MTFHVIEKVGTPLMALVNRGRSEEWSFKTFQNRWPLKFSFSLQILSFSEFDLLERLFEHFSFELFTVFQFEVNF